MKPKSQVVAYFQRHGTTTLNDDGRFRGPIDAPLDDKGLDDAHTASAFYQDKDLGDSWSSDKDRTETTARAILQPKGKTFTPDLNLRAWNVGYLAGEKKQDHKDDVEYFQSHPDVQVPGGESLDHFKQRVRAPILKAIHAGIQSGKPSLVVTHSSVIHELNHIIHNDHTHNLVKPGGIVAVHYDGKHFSTKAVFKPSTKEDHFAT